MKIKQHGLAANAVGSVCSSLEPAIADDSTDGATRSFKVEISHLPLLLTLDATAREMSLSKPAVERLVRERTLMSVKINGSRRVPRAAIRDLIEARLDAARHEAALSDVPASDRA